MKEVLEKHASLYGPGPVSGGRKFKKIYDFSMMGKR